MALEYWAGIWNSVLQPALATFWAWIQTTVFPLLQTLWDWLAVNVPAAITTLSDFWTGTLRPAIEGVWSWLSGTVFPFWESFAKLLEAVVGKAVEALAGIWENTLQPALETVYDFVKENLQPIWETFSAFFEDTLGPALNTFRTGAWAMFEEAIDGVQQAIEAVKKIFDDLADAIKNFHLPEWMRRESPSPFEMVFIGANKELEQLTRIRLPDLQAAFKNIELNVGTIYRAPTEAPAQAPTIIVNANLSDQIDVYEMAYTIAEVWQKRR